MYIYIYHTYIDHMYIYIYHIPGIPIHFSISQGKKKKSRRVSPQEFIDAVKWLEMRGVAGITGDCGFMMAFQPLASTLSIVLQELMVFFLEIHG